MTAEGVSALAAITPLLAYTNAQFKSNPPYTDPQIISGNQPGLDASKFILGFSLQKDDVNNFATGIDASQSGSVQLKLYFEDPNYVRRVSANASLDIHIMMTCDAVFTKQNDADLVRF
jgi:hypothetical protein